MSNDQFIHSSLESNRAVQLGAAAFYQEALTKEVLFGNPG